jgi:hypothetical protein
MSNPAYSQSSEALASLFLTVSKVVAGRITAESWPLTVPMQKTLVERNKADLDNWWGSTVEVQQNVFAHHDAPLHQLAPLLPPEVASTVLTCASNLVTLPASNLPFWSVFGDKSGVLMKVTEVDQQVSDSDGAANWTASHLLLPALLAHLINLPSVDVADTDAAQRFATEVMHVATAQELSYIVTVPLAGIDVKAKSGVVRANEDVFIRRLSSEEQGALLEDGLRSLSIGNTETLPYVALERQGAGGEVLGYRGLGPSRPDCQFPVGQVAVPAAARVPAPQLSQQCGEILRRPRLCRGPGQRIGWSRGAAPHTSFHRHVFLRESQETQAPGGRAAA